MGLLVNFLLNNMAGKITTLEQKIEKLKTMQVEFNFPAPPLSSDEELEQLLKGEGPYFQWIGWYEYLFGLPHTSFTRELLLRFKFLVNDGNAFLNAIPHRKKYPRVARILSPLREACRCYCFESYSSCIAMSGVAAEMMTILLWEMNRCNIQFHTKKISRNMEKVIFGNHFSSSGLTQERRLQILKSLDLISKEQKEKFDFVRKKRNEVVHVWNRSLSWEKVSAQYCYWKTIALFKDITGMKVDSGKLKVKPEFFDFLNT